MKRFMVGSRRLSFAGLAACALVLAGCSSAPRQAAVAHYGGSARVSVSAGRAATLRMPGGLIVQVPAKAAAGSGTLAGSQIQPPAPAPKDMTLASPTYRLEVTGARLTGKVRLTLPVPALTSTAASGPDAVLLAYYDTASQSWVPVPATYDPAAHTLTALTPHLSVWTVLRVDASALLAGATNLLKGFLDISGTTSQPSCPGHAELAAAGITTASDKGDLVKWCAGVADGEPLLQVADNRHYAMEADYPSSWQASQLEEADPLTSAITADVAKALSPASVGEESAIIGGGQTEQFTVPSGTVGQVDVRPSSEAFLIDALLYGADTLGMTMDDIPGAPSQDLTNTQRAISLALDAKDCVAQADRLVRDKVTSAATAGQYFRDDVEWAVGCLGDEWQEAYGLTGAIGSFVVSVVLWLADGIRLVVDGVQSAIDSAVYWRDYRIAIGSPQEASCTAQALGAAAHAYDVAQGQSSSTDTNEINAYGCDDGYAEILFTASPGGGPSYQAATAFKSVAGRWQFIGGGDYIPPGSYGMPVSVGQALVKALQANAGTDTGVSF